MSRPTILVIEDDASVRHTLVDILDLNGYDPRSAADGSAGLAAAREAPPALIITDIAMPGLDGFNLLEALRSDPELRTIPVIVISAKVDRASTRHGMELGADDYITKPFTEEEVLRSIEARLEKKELLDELDAFSHTVAHDLRSPLSTLIGRLDLLLLRLDAEHGHDLRRQAEEAGRSARRLNEIIDELLILSGVRRQSVVLAPLDMSALVDDAVDRLESLLQATGARVKKTCTPCPAAIGHGPWVVEIWVNYLSNAAKYGGENPTIEIGGEPLPGGTHARFWVQDHGPGLPPEIVDKLFVPFTRINAVRAKGHGLGLSIVRRIAEKLHGTVGVDTGPDRGARFWFELPVAAS